MSVLIETSLGDLVVDLDVENCPRTCENFIKLSKAYKYNYITFFSVQKNFIAQTGDPTNDGQGGASIWSMLAPDAPQHSSEAHFVPERNERTMRHNVRGTISMACKRRTARRDAGEGQEDDEEAVVAGSQFFVTLADNLDELDKRHAPFGRIVEGNEKDGTLDKINAAFVDQRMRPLRDIRIEHIVVLDDPFEDPAGLAIPSRTPSPTPQQLAPIGLDASAPLQDDQDRPEEEIEEERRKRDTNAAALTLEMVGDLPFAEVRPPENILFVCKLNPITQSEDLELIFSRFGKILTCEVVKDRRTGDSLQYAFIEFDEQKSAEQAYFKMQNVLVDDRRIWVDFSQSVSKLSGRWNAGRAGGKPLKVTNGRRNEDGRNDERRLKQPPASSSSRDGRSSHHRSSGADRRHGDRYDSRDRRAYDSDRHDRSPRRASDRDVDRDRRSTDNRRREEQREYSSSRRDDRHHHRRRTPSPVERRRDRR